MEEAIEMNLTDDQAERLKTLLLKIGFTEIPSSDNLIKSGMVSEDSKERVKKAK